jgi:hypothetical protein
VIGAAAVLAAVAVFILVGSPGPSGPGGSPSPSLAPTPAISAGPPVYRWVGPLEPGHYATSLSWDESLVFEFTVGQGWEARDINIRKGDHVSLAFYPIEDVAVDPCTRRVGERPVTPDAVLTAIGRLATIEGAPRATRLGDRDARYVEFTIEPPDGCEASAFGLIKLPQQTCTPGVCSGLGGEWLGLEFGSVTHHHRLWVMDVGRRPIAVDAIWTDDATPAELADLQGVIDSVGLQTPLATPAPSASG